MSDKPKPKSPGAAGSGTRCGGGSPPAKDQVPKVTMTKKPRGNLPKR
jgi:hypothetical protein